MRALLLVLLLPTSAFAVSWMTLSPGVERAALPGDIQAFRLDLTKVALRIARPKRPTSVATMAKGTPAVLAVNGGFFDPDFRSLGLLISEGRVMSTLRRVDWGVLVVTRSHEARLVHAREFAMSHDIEFAIEAGPRLVVGGKPTRLRPHFARRTAIGILPSKRSVILVVADASMTPSALATLFVRDLGCPFALNLDGGSSTQLWSTSPAVEAVFGKNVANAVLVVPRTRR